MVKNPAAKQETWIRSPCREDSHMGKEMAIPSSILV